MKINVKILVFLPILALVLAGCWTDPKGGAIRFDIPIDVDKPTVPTQPPDQQPDGDGDGDGGQTGASYTGQVPDDADIYDALQVGDPEYCQVAFRPLNDIVFPPCNVVEEGSPNLAKATAPTPIYSMLNLPAGYSFEAATRTLSVAGGIVPIAALSPINVIYRCNINGVDYDKPFVLDDCDGDTIIDNDEWPYSETPLLTENSLIRMTPDIIDFYRTPSRRISTRLTTTSVMSAVVAADAGGDIDSDTKTNAFEITNLTNPFVTMSSGSFGTLNRDVFTDANALVDLTVDDFDNNGSMDIIVSHTLGMFTYLNDGNGAFPIRLDDVTITNVGPTTSADIDGDGNIDIVVIRRAPPALFLYKGNGDGTFVADVPSYGAGGYPNGIVAGDFDNDGDVDVAVADMAGNSVLVYLWDALNDEFSAPVSYTDVSWVSPGAIATADFDSDGFLDLAFVTYGDMGPNLASLQILGNNGDGSFSSLDFEFHDTYYGFVSLAVADFDLDGDIDAAVGREPSALAESELIIFDNDGAGDFSNGGEYTVDDGVGGSMSDLVAGDLDGDGDADLAAPLMDSTTIVVSENDPPGEFHNFSHFDAGDPGADAAIRMTIADFYNSGTLDLSWTLMTMSPNDLVIAINPPNF